MTGAPKPRTPIPITAPAADDIARVAAGPSSRSPSPRIRLSTASPGNRPRSWTGLAEPGRRRRSATFAFLGQMGIGEALGRQDLIRAGDVRSNDDHLAGKLAAKETPVSLVETGAEIGERIRRNVVGPASKSYRYRISNSGGNPLIGKAYAIGDDPRRDAERARRQFERHGRNESFLGREDERRPADHVVDVGVDVQRTQIGATPDGEPLPDCREYRFVAALRLSEDDLSSSSAAGERTRCHDRSPEVCRRQCRPQSESGSFQSSWRRPRRSQLLGRLPQLPPKPHVLCRRSRSPSGSLDWRGPRSPRRGR